LIIMSTGLTIAGTVLQVAGLGISFEGIRRAWRDWPRVAGFFEPVIVWTKARWSAAWGFVRTALNRLLRRQPSVSVTVHGAAAEAFAFAQVGTVDKSYDPLPEGMAVESAIATLDERTRSLLRTFSDLENAHRKHKDVTEISLRYLRERMESHVTRLEEQDRRVAVGGLRLQAFGLFLVTVGVVVVEIGTLA